MSWLDFGTRSLGMNLAIFAAAAAVVWLAGTRISGYAGTIAERTGIGKAFLGVMLLGGITSLPELAVTSTSAALGDAPLAVNNLLGGIAMQVAILAVADAVYGRGALSAIIAQPVVLLQAVLGVVLLSAVAVAIGVGEAEIPGAGIGVGSTLLFVAYLAALWTVRQAERDPGWTADDAARGDESAPEPVEDGENARRSLRAVVLRTALAGLVILAAGYVLSRTGEAIAEQTGLGTSFVGAVLLAVSTSLPEVSTVVAAVRLRQYEMAFSDIFGTNLFDVALIFVADAVYRGPPVLAEVGRFSLLATLLGITVTALYLVGLLERRDRAVLRMGVDSWMVLVVYLAGVGWLYALR